LNGFWHLYKNKTARRNDASLGSDGLVGISISVNDLWTDAKLVDLGEDVSCCHPLTLCLSLGFFNLPFSRHFPHFYDFLLIWLLKKFIPWLKFRIKFVSLNDCADLARGLYCSCLSPECFSSHLLFQFVAGFNTELLLDLHRHFENKTVGSFPFPCSSYSLRVSINSAFGKYWVFCLGSKFHGSGGEVTAPFSGPWCCAVNFPPSRPGLNNQVTRVNTHQVECSVLNPSGLINRYEL
jgi:hypothetical protein